jgi:hypothetical protein
MLLASDTGGLGRVLMLPDVEWQPTGPDEGTVHLAVAFDVAEQLRLPIGAVRVRRRAVLGALVPEATVDEHGDLGPREGDVDPGEPPAFEADGIVASEASAGPVQNRPQHDLRSGVTLTVPPHDRRRRWRRRVRIVGGGSLRTLPLVAGKTGWR